MRARHGVKAAHLAQGVEHRFVARDREPGHLLADDKPPQVDPEILFKRADTNQDGKLSKEEFKKLLANAPRLKDNPRAIDLLFQRLDTNRDGRISRAEAAADSHIVFSTADSNGDGYLDSMEYKKAQKSGSDSSMPAPQPQSDTMPSDTSGTVPQDTVPQDQSSPPPSDTETPRQ